MSYETERKLRDCIQWLKYNQADFQNMDIGNRLQYLFDGMRGMMAVIAEMVSDIQHLEGRIPGDRDRKSTFPFPDSLADKKRLGEGASLIVPVKKALVGGRIVG